MTDMYSNRVFGSYLVRPYINGKGQSERLGRFGEGQAALV